MCRSWLLTFFFFQAEMTILPVKHQFLHQPRCHQLKSKKHDTSSDQMKHLVVVQSLMSWQEFLTCQASLVWEFSQTSSCFFWQWPSHWKRVGFAQCCNKRNTIASCSRFAYLVQAFRRNNTPCQFLFKSDLRLCVGTTFLLINKRISPISPALALYCWMRWQPGSQKRALQPKDRSRSRIHIESRGH